MNRSLVSSPFGSATLRAIAFGRSRTCAFNIVPRGFPYAEKIESYCIWEIDSSIWRPGAIGQLSTLIIEADSWCLFSYNWFETGKIGSVPSSAWRRSPTSPPNRARHFFRVVPDPIWHHPIRKLNSGRPAQPGAALFLYGCQAQTNTPMANLP